MEGSCEMVMSFDETPVSGSLSGDGGTYGEPISRSTEPSL